MNETPFENMGTDFGTVFSTGVTSATANGLNAIAAPLMSLVVLWVIIQGVLVMRGDIDTRSGVTKIIRVALVVGLLTSAGLYDTYVQTLFMTTLPNWVAQSVAGGTPISSTPQAFDQIWNTTVHQVQVVQAQINWYDLVDGITLAVIQIVCDLLLLVTFAIYEITQVMIGVVVAVGPFVVAGYLFDATKGVAERWLGKLIGLALLTLLINIVMHIIVQGDELYMRAIVNNPASGAGAVPIEIQILLELVMFFAIGAFIVVSLPPIATAIGGGVGFNAGAVARTITNVITGGATAAARGSVGAGERLSGRGRPPPMSPSNRSA